MKLSSNQSKVVKQMQEGWKLSLFGCFNGANSNYWVNMGRIRQHNPKGYSKEENVSKSTIKALEKKGLIRIIPTEDIYSDLYRYQLTKKGKNFSIVSKSSGGVVESGK